MASRRAPAKSKAQDAPRKAPARRKPAAKAGGPVDSLMGKFVPDLPLLGMVRDLGRWADTMLATAGAGAKVAGLVSPVLNHPAATASLQRAGALLHDVRETAGLSIQDLGRAIDLKDATLIEHFEAGKVALPFDVILRIAAVLGRNDPLPFVMRLLRESNPRLAKTLEDLGVGKLVVHIGREREFVNLYRGKDELRSLDDEEFAALLQIVDAALKMALSARHGMQRAGRPLAD
ncbi:MAG: helix-turn-helix transcriptional regulator [Burkholderiales bacterium]|nr:helix-turn-helix transcriptional regulator [Burkholderiales bacterium]